MNDIIHQMAAQGFSVEAIASFTHMGVARVQEQLAAIGTAAQTGAAIESGENPAQRQCASIESMEVVATPLANDHRRRTAEDIGRATLERLAARRAQQQVNAQALRAEIKRLADAARGPTRGLAKRIRRQLSAVTLQRGSLPALRTVQWHLKEIGRSRE
jgi:hypothetical protein